MNDRGSGDILEVLSIAAGLTLLALIVSAIGVIGEFFGWW